MEQPRQWKGATPSYAQALPPSGQRSRDAHARSYLHRRAGALKGVMERAMCDAHIGALELGWAQSLLGEAQHLRERATIAALAERAGANAARALANTLARAGVLACTEEAAEHAWAPQAKHDARAWLKRSAAPERWLALASAIGRAADDAHMAPMGIGALATVASRHPEITRKLAQVDPWVAREACRTMEIERLREPCERWPARIVQHRAEKMGAEVVSEARAEAALADWRWPRAEPPLGVVAAGAAALAPIEGDSAWANALGMADRTGVGAYEACRAGGSKGVSAWAAKARQGEDQAIEEARARVRALARRHPLGADEGALARWRARWGAHRALAGDGAIALPALALVEPAREHGMKWVFALENPEVLLAVGTLAGLEAREIIDVVTQKHGRLALNIECASRSGHLEQGATRAPEEAESLGRALRACAGIG